LYLTILWVGAIATETWWKWPRDEPRFGTPVEKSKPGMFDDLIPAPPSGFVVDKPPFDPSKPYLVVKDDERRTAVQSAIVLAFTPPAFILAFGSALVWAFRGFRP
jgi:hypothetical protein